MTHQHLPEHETRTATMAMLVVPLSGDRALTAQEVQHIVGEAVATSATSAPQAAAVAMTNPSSGCRGIYTTLKELTANTKRVDSLIVEYVPLQLIYMFAPYRFAPFFVD